MHASSFLTSNFFVFTDCPNPTQAFEFWYQYILGFETKHWVTPSWNISRQTPDYSENFAFLQKNVLFIGINVVGGIVHDQTEWDSRLDANVQWINKTVNAFNDTFETLVVLGHSDPEIDINESFYTPFFTMVSGYSQKVIYMHRNLGVEAWNVEPEYNSIPNVDVVVVEGSLWPPMWVQIDTVTGSYSVDQETWYQNYVDSGTMTSPP
jgi:hypothetical protein